MYGIRETVSQKRASGLHCVIRHELDGRPEAVSHATRLTQWPANSCSISGAGAPPIAPVLVTGDSESRELCHDGTGERERLAKVKICLPVRTGLRRMHNGVDMRYRAG